MRQRWPLLYNVIHRCVNTCCMNDEKTANIGLVGYRGGGKTTLCYRLVGLTPPCIPQGTASLDYLSCKWNDLNVLIWDFPPGVNNHTQSHLKDMDFIVICIDGRNLRSAYNSIVAMSMYDAPVVLAITRMSSYVWCMPFLLSDAGSYLYNVPVFPCYSSTHGLMRYLHDQFTKDSRSCMRRVLRASDRVSDELL